MEIIRDVPEILVNEEFCIKTVRYFDEDEDKVILEAAEVIPEFKRGFTCDLACKFPTKNPQSGKESFIIENIKDLVLVYINKSSSVDDITTFEYVFYK